MGARHIERLYRKMITFQNIPGNERTIDPRIRAELFEAIMDDLEVLVKKIKRCKKGTRKSEDLALQIRNLLLKEVQVIIDEYVLSQKNGTLEQWKEMYGDIKYYIKNFYCYRAESIFKSNPSISSACGFYEGEE